MNIKASENRDFDPIEQAAAEWTVRIARGLTPQEQDNYTEWLGVDRKHRKAMSIYQWGWDEMDRLAGLQVNQPAIVDPDLLDPDRNIIPNERFAGNVKYWSSLIAVVAVVALSFVLLFDQDNVTDLSVQPALDLMARIEQEVLQDGSTVELNRGCIVEVEYTVAERRVRLLEGEAVFDVEKDPARPFIVNVGGMDVRAVGTVFSVKYLSSEVSVVVAEGQVGVTKASSGLEASRAQQESFLNVGQMGTIDLQTESPFIQVTDLNADEIEILNRWRPKLLEFDATPLSDIVIEFNHRNPVQIVLEGSSTGSIELSSSFWSDNVEGFVRLMVSSFGMEAEWRGSQEIVLRMKDIEPI